MGTIFTTSQGKRVYDFYNSACGLGPKVPSSLILVLDQRRRLYGFQSTEKSLLCGTGRGLQRRSLDVKMLEAELFAFLDNTLDPVFAARESGEICFWNHAAETLFGYPAEEVIGKTCSMVLHGVGALGTEVCIDHCAKLQWGKQSNKLPNLLPNFDLNVTAHAGERIWVNISTISYLNRRTGKMLLVHLVRDISAQKEREEAFRRMIAISKEVSALEDTITGAAPIAPLSSHELEILRKFATGGSAPRIAKTLGISPQTLRNHLHHINQKLRTHNRLEAVTHAQQRHLI
jgi:DNA-binding CsgD family transcriptional regulator/PAS domain-containing protein